MNTTLNAFKVGLFFIFGTVLIYVVYITLNSQSINKTSGYSLIAEFSDMNTLSIDSDVRMAGVKIGSVKSTSLKEGRAQAELLITNGYTIPRDSTAGLAMASLLGSNYVSIEYGNPASGVLSAGDMILTRKVFSINEIMGQISSLGEKLNQIADGFSGFNSEGTTKLFENLNDMVASNKDKVSNIIDNLDKVSQKLNNGEGTLGKLISDETAYDELIATVKEIRTAATDAQKMMDNAQDVFAQIKSGNGTVGKLIYDDTIANEMNAIVANFKTFSAQLNSPKSSLGRLINDDTLFLQFKGILNKAEQSLDSVGDAGPITALGVAANALF
jgi:phospholipid/cholesterol/gamma-HCH transport system substrate-binding protein